MLLQSISSKSRNNNNRNLNRLLDKYNLNHIDIIFDDNGNVSTSSSNDVKDSNFFIH